MFPYKQTPSQQVLWNIIWKMSSEWPHNQPLPSSGWRRKLYVKSTWPTPDGVVHFPKTRNVGETIADSGWASHCLHIFEKKALAILFLAPSWKKNYVQSSYWETTADSLLILFSALSCHPGSHQKTPKSGQTQQNNKISWEVLQSWATQPLALWPKKFEDQHGAFERLTYENILSLMDYKSQLLLGAI